LLDTAGQGRLRNDSTIPHRRDEVVFADYAITIFNEVDQNIENLRLYGDELVAPAQRWDNWGDTKRRDVMSPRSRG
jgi:hypothetical protein